MRYLGLHTWIRIWICFTVEDSINGVDSMCCNLLWIEYCCRYVVTALLWIVAETLSLQPTGSPEDRHYT